MKFVIFALVTSVFGSGENLRGAKSDNSWIKEKENTPSIRNPSEVRVGRGDRSWIADRFPLAAGQVKQTQIPAKPKDVASITGAGKVSNLALINPSSISGADDSSPAYGGETPPSVDYAEISRKIWGDETPPSVDYAVISRQIWGGASP